jgi:microcystin-dependent protein
MSEPYVGEIRAFGFNFAPIDWAFCNGALLPIDQYQALFAIIGTTYGGNGTTNFALPNLQGQAPMHWGTSPGFNTVIGEVQGTTSVTLLTSQIPSHVHPIVAASPAAGQQGELTAVPNNQSFLSFSAPPNQAWAAAAGTTTPFSPKAISQAGGSLPHNNMQPYLTLNFCIALYGIFPSQN